MGRALSGLLLLIGATAAHAEVQLQVDARPARAVLAILERGRLDEAGRVEDIVAKLVSLGQAVTLDDYHRSLAAVAAGEPSPADPLRFAQVGAHREAIERTVQAAVSAPKGLARRVAALIEPYSPGETDVALTLVLVAGSNSCGWTTDSPDHLFIDLRCIRDDLAGLELLAAHEVYHGVQSHFMHADAAELSDEHNRVAMILRGLITEGGASYVADFMRTEGEAGYYIAFNRSEYQRNFDRIDQAVTLLDALVQLAAGDPSADGNLIYRLGFSGYWDSPLYYVGYRMMQALESGRGRETLNRLVTEPPERLLLAFAALPPEQRSFTLSPRTVAAVQALADARASASRGSP